MDCMPSASQPLKDDSYHKLPDFVLTLVGHNLIIAPMAPEHGLLVHIIPHQSLNLVRERDPSTQADIARQIPLLGEHAEGRNLAALREPAQHNLVLGHARVNFRLDELVDRLDCGEDSGLVFRARNDGTVKRDHVKPTRHPHPAVNCDWDAGRVRQDPLYVWERAPEHLCDGEPAVACNKGVGGE